MITFFYYYHDLNTGLFGGMAINRTRIGIKLSERFLIWTNTTRIFASTRKENGDIAMETLTADISERNSKLLDLGTLLRVRKAIPLSHLTSGSRGRYLFSL